MKFFQSYACVVFQAIYAFEDMDRSNRLITWSMHSCFLPSCSFFAIPCLCVTVGQTNCCPLLETKDAHSRERIDTAIASKSMTQISVSCSNVWMVSALVSFLCFLLMQAKKQETFRKGGWLLCCIAFQWDYLCCLLPHCANTS